MSCTNPLVSVLIPSYNHEKYVQETIKSIINQTYQNIELIVLDDGSKDFTWQKICEIKDRCDERFTSVHFETKENEGTCQTFNKLINYAKGDYIYIIASDDLAKPNAIEEEVKFIEAHQDYALVTGNDEIIDGESKVGYWDKDRNLVYNKKHAKYKTFKDFLQAKSKVKFTSDKFGLYESLYIGNYIPNGYLIRKSVLKFFEPFTLRAPLEDWYLMLQIAKYSRMKYIDKVLFSYRWHGSNSVKNDEKMAEFARITSEYEEEVLKNIDETKVLPNVLKVKKYGSCYKKQGIPFIFQILTIKKKNKKYKKIKLLNIPIITYEKDKK